MVDKELVSQAIKKFENVDAQKVLEILQNFGFNHSARSFEHACFEPIIKYFKDRNKLTDEEFLALLVRLCMMYFIEVKHSESLWFLLLVGLLPEELQRAKKSIVVEKFERQFIEYMQMIAERHGVEVMRDSILFFLFGENAEFVASWFSALDIVLEKIKNMLN
ncbi:TPA: hypothetical protein [Aquificae Conch Spring virus]|nr:TPA: hypothetical protein [Aquificae Conch Spring virus]